MSQPTGGVILVHDTQPDQEKTLLELKVKKAAPAPAPDTAGQASGAAEGGQDRGVGGFGTQLGQPQTPGGQGNIAAVLNSMDEGEGEAPVPNEFDYESSGEEEKE